MLLPLGRCPNNQVQERLTGLKLPLVQGLDMRANGSVHGNDISFLSPDLEAAWREECAAAERLREAQTAAAKAAHDLSIRQHERKQLENVVANGAHYKHDAPRSRSARKRSTRLQTWLVAPLIAVGLGGFAYWGWTATSVRVCSTSMTAGAARDLLRAHNDIPYHYTLAPDNAGPCQVRFYATTSTDPGSLIARDGVVAIVNPDTPVHQLTASQLQQIFTGRLTNWSKVGAAPGPIVAMIPPDGSDEARVARAFLNQDIDPSVQRTSTSDIVKFIASPSGKNAIGLVPYSTAAAAKVVAIAGATPPSSASIANGQYPLSLGLVAESDYRHPNAGASSLIAFARTHDAHVILARADLTTKGVP